MAGNGGVSYQKAGTSDEAPTSDNGATTSSPSNRLKWIVGAALVAILGIGYTVLAPHGPSSDVVDKAVAKSGLQVKADGKIKLFDEFSK